MLSTRSLLLRSVQSYPSSDECFTDLEQAGTCGVMGTASTMACVVVALGLMPFDGASAAAVSTARPMWLRRFLSFEAAAFMTAPLGAMFPRKTTIAESGYSGSESGLINSLEYLKGLNGVASSSSPRVLPLIVLASRCNSGLSVCNKASIPPAL